jgi:hypothetical protein
VALDLEGYRQGSLNEGLACKTRAVHIDHSGT